MALKTKTKNLLLLIPLCMGLISFVLGSSGSASAFMDVFSGYDASVPYGSSASFTFDLGYGSGGQFYWSGPGTWYDTATSSTFVSNPSLAPDVYSATCYYFAYETGASGEQTYTWIVNAPPQPTPTPSDSLPTLPPEQTASPPPTSTPTPYYPTPTPTPYYPPPPSYTLYTTVSGSGTVTRNPQLSSYPLGTAVILTAVASAGWHFDHWQEVQPYSGALYQNPLAFNIDANYAFTAVFAQNPAPAPTPTPTASPTPYYPTPTPTPYNPNPTSTPTPPPGTSAISINVFGYNAQVTGVTVKVYNPQKTQEFFSGTTNANAYVQPSLASGSYVAVASKAGYITTEKAFTMPTASIIITLYPVGSTTPTPSATPQPTPTLAPPASLPPSNYTPPEETGQNDVNRAFQVVGLATVFLTLIAYVPVNGWLGKKR